MSHIIFSIYFHFIIYHDHIYSEDLSQIDTLTYHMSNDMFRMNSLARVESIKLLCADHDGCHESSDITTLLSLTWRRCELYSVQSHVMLC